MLQLRNEMRLSSAMADVTPASQSAARPYNHRFHSHIGMDPEEFMDTTVRRDLSGNWGVSDLLERSICSIIRDPHGSCWIVLGQDQVARLTDIRKGPFLSVDAAMTAIEKNLNGPCRHRTATVPTNYFP